MTIPAPGFLGVKFATAAPEGVNRSSGSATRLPITVMVVSPAMRSPQKVLLLCRLIRGAPGDAPIVGRGHHHLLIREQLERLGAC